MNKFVIADPNLCIGCRTCEVACAVAHQTEGQSQTTALNAPFHPRLRVVTKGKVTAPILCRQCEDKPCAQACPNGAIVTEAGCVVVHQERCIGCKSCVIACPYGAMQVVTHTKAAAANSLFNCPTVKAEALKCDLCRHRAEGPACVGICPTAALRLMTPELLEELSKERQLATLPATPL